MEVQDLLIGKIIPYLFLFIRIYIFESFDCFLVHVPSKVDEVVVYEIMSQLTKDNVDFSVLDKISITNLGGEN